MVKLKNPLFSLGAVGRLTKALTFTRRNKTSIVETISDPRDVKSDLQLTWRTMFLMARDLWHQLSAAEKTVWEAAGTVRHMTGYAWFISQALRPNPGIYLPLLGGTMQGNIGMAGFKIEDLPDPAAAQEPVTRQYFEDNLPAGGYTQGAAVYHSVSQTIPNNTATILAFDQERYDTDDIHDPITNNSRLTCKTAGKYILVFNGGFTQNAAGWRQYRFKLNGVTYLGLNLQGFDLDGRSFTTITSIRDLSLTDYVEIEVFQNSGVPLDLLTSPSQSAEFMMQRIG